MRFALVAGLAVVASATSGPVPASDPDATVLSVAERYEEALRKKDKAALESLIHKDYLHCHRGGGLSLSIGEADKFKVVTHYTKPDIGFRSLSVDGRTIRLFRDTAIETGSIAGEEKGVFGITSVFGSRRYTRVWIRDAKGWQLVQESY